MKVKDYLPKLKANRYTYYNLNQKTIQDFKNLYNYLKKHKEKECSDYMHIYKIFTERNHYSDFLKKYKTMSILSQTIKH
tara:strand:+ start:237 stop:473 length:237 start_codon:yes stop_codon:yes gene_type:complete